MFPGKRTGRIFTGFNSLNFVGQNRRMGIVNARTGVEVLNTSILNSLLCMKSQLLEDPVVARLFNVCFPNFPVSHDLTGCVENVRR